MNKLAYLLLFLGITTLAVFADETEGETGGDGVDTGGDGDGEDAEGGAENEDDNNGVVNMGGDIRLALAMGVGAYIFGNFLV